MLTVKIEAAVGGFALAAILVAGNVVAGTNGPKGEVSEVDTAPFTLIVEKPDQSVTFSGIVATDDGGYWLSGATVSDGVGTGSGYLARVGADGTLQGEHYWSIEGAQATEFRDPVALADGRIAVAATTPRFEETPDGGAVILSPAGAFGGHVLLSGFGLRNTEVLSVTPLSDGGLALVGAKSARTETGQAVVVRLNADLERRWIVTETAREPGFGLNAYTSAALGDGDLIVGGASTDATETKGAGWVARFGADGGVIWRRWIDAGSLIRDEHAIRADVFAVAVTSSGNIGLLLTAYAGTNLPEARFLALMTPDGELAALHRLDLVPRDVLSSLAATRDGDFLVGCYDGAKQVPFVARYGADGVLRWTRTLDDMPGGFARGLLEAEDGSIVVAGGYDGSAGTAAGFVVRLRMDGSRV